jgi:hypothetical protein
MSSARSGSPFSFKSLFVTFKSLEYPTLSMFMDIKGASNNRLIRLN